jgi:YD repeat-containing protein
MFIKLEMLMKASFLTALLAISLSTPLLAQTYIKPPEFEQVDKNGVDLLSGNASLTIPVGSIGSDMGELRYVEYWQANGRRDSLYSDLYRYQDDNNLQIYVVLSIENASKKFRRQANGSYVVDRGSLETLVEGADGRSFVYTQKDGEQYTFGIPPIETNLSGSSGYCTSNSATSPWAQCGLVLLRRALPSGIELTYQWDSHAGLYARPVRVSNNLGYEIGLSYLLNSTPNINNFRDWAFVTGIHFRNLSQTSTSVYSGSRSLIQRNLPGSGGYYTEVAGLNTVGGEVWEISNSTVSGPTAVKMPSSNVINWSFPGASPTHLASPPTVNLVVNGMTYGYRFHLSGGLGRTSVTDPTGATAEINYSKYTSKVSSSAFPTSAVNPLGQVTSYESLGHYIITSVTHPEGNKEIYGYDSRDNLVSKTYRPKPGSGLPDLTESADYPATCSNSITCNRPILVRDKRGYATEFSYSPDHGGILTETRPPDTNGVRPVIRSVYAQRYAWVGNGAGGYQQVNAPVWLKVEERTCRTTATVGNACAGGSTDEVVTLYDYGSNAGPNNLALRGVVINADNVSHRTCYSYDQAGRRISETKPMANLTSCP